MRAGQPKDRHGQWYVGSAGTQAWRSPAVRGGFLFDPAVIRRFVTRCRRGPADGGAERTSCAAWTRPGGPANGTDHCWHTSGAGTRLTSLRLPQVCARGRSQIWPARWSSSCSASSRHAGWDARARAPLAVDVPRHPEIGAPVCCGAECQTTLDQIWPLCLGGSEAGEGIRGHQAGERLGTHRIDRPAEVGRLEDLRRLALGVALHEGTAPALADCQRRPCAPVHRVVHARRWDLAVPDRVLTGRRGARLAGPCQKRGLDRVPPVGERPENGLVAPGADPTAAVHVNRVASEVTAPQPGYAQVMVSAEVVRFMACLPVRWSPAAGPGLWCVPAPEGTQAK